ncbi:MAG: hypothetical protein GY850_46810 [bacterium]|nr:hypothetical protein [bacterium]
MEKNSQRLAFRLLIILFTLMTPALSIPENQVQAPSDQADENVADLPEDVKKKVLGYRNIAKD